MIVIPLSKYLCTLPRKIFYFKKDIFLPKKKKVPTYLFQVGQNKNESFDFGQFIYSYNDANEFCYRVPNKPCRKNTLNVYKLKNNENIPKNNFKYNF